MKNSQSVVNKKAAEQAVNAILDKKPTRTKWLLFKFDKIRTSTASSLVEKISLIFGGVVLLQSYDYIHTNNLDMAHFIFLLVAFIIAIAARCFYRFDKITQQLALISEAIRQMPTDEGKDDD